MRHLSHLNTGVTKLPTIVDCFVLQVDDGFWEGELNGQIGVFPSLVVELVHNEEQEEEEKQETEVRLEFLGGFPEGYSKLTFLIHLCVFFLQPIPTPTMPHFSPPLPMSSPPGCSSAPNTTPPSCVEDKQQVFPSRLTHNTAGKWGNLTPVTCQLRW